MSASAALLLAAACFGQSRALPPADGAERAPVQMLTPSRALPASFQTPDFVFTADLGRAMLSVAGQDKAGRRWTVNLPPALHGVWRSDQGGERTYYFAGHTGSAGAGPEVWLLSLSFDAQGLPVPFYLVTFGEYGPEGIANLLNQDGGSPELLEQQYWGNIMDDPGYFVTTLYRKRGPYWERADGPYGAYEFPAYELWSILWRGRPAELVRGTPPTRQPLRDSGNDPARGIRVKLQSAGDSSVRAGEECDSLGVGVMVIDTPEGRRIEMDEQTLRQLAENQANVVLTGLYRWPGTRKSCDASILWTAR